jgi:hypothetical protein
MGDKKGSTRSNGIRSAVAFVFAALFFAAGAPASQTSAVSSAMSESVQLSVQPPLGAPTLTVSGPMPMVAGTAPPSFDQSAKLPSVSVSTALTGRILATGLLTAHAASGVPGSDSASADTSVASLMLVIIPNAQLFAFTATAVRSTAGLSGTCATGLVPIGTTALTKPKAGGTLAPGLNVPTSPAPNTVLLSAPGLSVVLNEQIPVLGLHVQGVTVNAIHVYLNGLVVSGVGILTGEIVIGQSRAQIYCGVHELRDDLETGETSDPEGAPGSTGELTAPPRTHPAVARPPA